MANITNDNTTIGIQNTAGRDINILINSNQRRTLSTDNIEFHLPRLINTFRGREDEIQQLTHWFFEDKKRMVVISGLPGFGKTELSKQFVRRCKENNLLQNILWMNAETQETLLQSFKDLARRLDLHEFDYQTIVEKVYQHFGDNSSIFVMDNALDRRSIMNFEPGAGCECLLLATSHVKDWGDDVTSLELNALTPAAAVDVVRAALGDRYNEDNYELYMELVDVLSCIPLALQLAVAYIRQEIIELGNEFNLQIYVRELENSRNEIIDMSPPNFSNNPYNLSVYESIKQSVRKIEKSNNETSKLALQVLHVCAYLNSENVDIFSIMEITNTNISETTRNISIQLFNGYKVTKELRKALSLLINYLFININNDYQNHCITTMHRLVQNCLIYYQRVHDKENQIKIYTKCLELYKENPVQNSIIKHADTNIDTFFQFYCKYKSIFLSKNYFFENLILSGCIKVLTKIFHDLGRKAKKIINKMNLVYLATMYKEPEILKLFLDLGASVGKTKHELYPLSIAVYELDLECVQLLTDYGADVNTQFDGRTSILHIFMSALNNSNKEVNRETVDIWQLLLEKGARPDAGAVDSDKRTLLHLAASALSEYFIDLLVNDYKLDVNAQATGDWTPLYFVLNRFADPYRNKELGLKLCECLVKHGARLDVVDEDGKTPAQFARDKGIEFLANYLENVLTEDENHAGVSSRQSGLFSNFIVKIFQFKKSG